jgi:dTDP-glucose 4,6-dehydratase
MIKNKILILGASSFGGLSATIHLLNKGHNVVGTYNKNKKKITNSLKKLKLINKITLEKLELKNDSLKLNKIVKKYKPNIIIDFASICLVPESWDKPLDYFKINVDSKIPFWKNLNDYHFLKKYIYISTPEIFGSSNQPVKEDSIRYNPSTPYALSKLTSESLIRLFQKSHKNQKFIIARFSNFYGPMQDKNRLIPKVLKSIRLKRKFPLHGEGKTIRNFIYADDFCEGICKILKYGKIGNTYHFTSNEYLTIKNIVKKIYKFKNENFFNNVQLVPDRKGKDFCYKLSSKATHRALRFKPKINLDKGIKLISNVIEN